MGPVGFVCRSTDRQERSVSDRMEAIELCAEENSFGRLHHGEAGYRHYIPRPADAALGYLKHNSSIPAGASSPHPRRGPGEALQPPS